MVKPNRATGVQIEMQPKDLRPGESGFGRSCLHVKAGVKRALGSGVVFLAEQVPALRKYLKSLGLRISPGSFTDRIVSIWVSTNGPFRLTHVDENYLSFQLFWRGGDYYEPITRQFLQTLLQPGDTFVDLGAHVGFFSLVVGRHVPGVKVIAFEPNAKNFRILLANTAANDLNQIICEPIAISDTSGTATLYLTESDMSASLMKDFQAKDTKQIDSLAVRTTSLDHYLRQHRI